MSPWADRQTHEAALRENFFSLAATRQRHVGTSPNAENYDPDLWTDELAFLSRPGQQDIQTDLFYDYRTNVASYPAWQDWLRKRQPPLQVVWGRYDPSFQVEEAEAYHRDVPDAEVHVLDAGHFALDEQPDLIADLTRRFLQRRQAHTDGWQARGYPERHQDSEHRDPVKIEEHDRVSRRTRHSYRAGSGQSAPGGRTLRYARPAPQAVRARLPHLTAARWAFSPAFPVTQCDV
jgi:hypothetical protein